MTAMAESYPLLVVCKGRAATLHSPPPTFYSRMPINEGTINAHLGKHHTGIMLHRFQPAIAAICNDRRILVHCIRITNPIAVSRGFIAHGVIARARPDAIFEGVDPNIHDVAVGLISVAEEVIGSVADDGIVGRGYVVAIACGYQG